MIQKWLIGLNATGTGGFEGLMRDVLSELTGLSFSIAKSGPQGGSDVRVHPSNFIRVGLEAKRYGQGSTLPLDQLKAKILEAVQEPAPIDVWILAATREISATDREGLHAVADQQGIKLVVWDWPKDGSSPPALTLALAAAPMAVATHIGPDTVIREALDSIGALPDVAIAMQRLIKELCEPDSGYVAATNSASEWLEVAQSAKTTSLSRLRGHHDLKSQLVKAIPRSGISSWLDQWWRSKEPVAALLGDEGLGKTWAALSWWNELSLTRAQPLTVFLSAKDISNMNAEDMIASALARQTEMRDEAFWRRRLAIWRKSSSPLPILIILDGLNQNWTKLDWAEFIQPLFAEDQRGRYRVLITCWPGWWIELGGLMRLEPPPRSIKIDGFSEVELDAIFKEHGVSRQEFTHEMIALLKVPRLFSLALRYRQELAESGDITAERLAYEDWKHRLRHGSARPNWTDEEFKDFISNLGKEFKHTWETATISSKYLMERLGEESGADHADLRVTIQDVVAGRWLVSAGKPHRYRINAEMTPYVLGLALSSELHDVQNKNVADAIIADFIDPYRGQTLGTRILRAASTAALLNLNVKQGGRYALLDRWFREQNFGISDIETWWRLIGTDVDLFCLFAERAWLLPKSSFEYAGESILVDAFARAYQFPTVASGLRKAIARWLGWSWGVNRSERDIVTLSLPECPGTPDLSEKPPARSLSEKQLGAASIPGSGDRADLNRLGNYTFSLLSLLPRASMKVAFEAWAMSRATMRTPHHLERLEWILRFNREDEADARAMIIGVSDHLLAIGDQRTNLAATWLLEALGDRETLGRSAELQEVLDAKTDDLNSEGSIDNEISPLNPSALVEPPKTLVDGSALWRFAPPRFAQENALEEIEHFLCRADPARLESIYLQTAATGLSRSAVETFGLAKNIHKIILMISNNNKERLSGHLRQIAKSPDVKEEMKHTCRVAAAIIDMWRKPALEQWRYIQSEKLPADVLEAVRPILVSPLENELRVIELELRTIDVQPEVDSALFFLLETGALNATVTWPGAALLVLTNEPQSRHRALLAAIRSKNPAALSNFAKSRWAWHNTKSKADRVYGSMALSTAADVLDDVSLLDRACPEIWCYRLVNGDESDECVSRVNELLRQSFEDLERGGEVDLPPPMGVWGSAIAKLLKLGRASLFEWFTPWMEARKSIPSSLLVNHSPIYNLVQVLLANGEVEGLHLWKKIAKSPDKRIAGNSAIPFFPLQAPEEALNFEVTKMMLDALTTDRRIRNFVYGAIKHGKAAWLANRIEDDVTSFYAGRQARGWMMLGFADDQPVFADLWGNLEAFRPKHQWLATVWTNSRREFLRNTWAQHWFKAFKTAADDRSAYCAFELLRRTIDERSNFWERGDNADTELLDSGLASYLHLNRSALSEVSQRRQAEEDERLYGLSVLWGELAPWI